YIIGGYSNSGISGNKTENSNGDYDYWLLKLDSAGTIRWQNTVGGAWSDNLNSIRQTNDGGYILGGHSQSPVSGDKTENSNGDYDYWIIKLAPDTITSITQLPQLPNYPITISPNPLTTQSKLTFKNPDKEKFLFTLYDITGRITESVSTTNNEIILTKGSKQPGVYLFHFDKLSVTNEKTGEKWNGKIVIY
ncbi:MAG TPA: T9SS type A sorting domain-containing protein, partial [Bacteroidia bacterium]|nr:T9SS type A sorting domain-containing protein [Bacteroidia bacterium]